jgi:AcrR family transcriptional regulator
MARKPAHRGRPRSLQSEEAILEATGKLLSSEGYLGLTVSKVAARARASKSTIYRRWPTKEHLVMAAFDRWPVMVPRDRGDLLSDLLDLYQQYLRVHYRTPTGAIVPTLVAERVSNHLSVKAMRRLFVVQLRGLRARGY